MIHFYIELPLRIKTPLVDRFSVLTAEWRSGRPDPRGRGKLLGRGWARPDPYGQLDAEEM